MADRTETKTIMTHGVVNEDGAWVHSSTDVEQKIDDAIGVAMLTIAGTYFINHHTIKDVIITPLDLGGMIFLAVTVIAEWNDDSK